MKSFIRIISLLTAILLCIPLISSCGTDTSAGLVNSVIPESTVGKLISTSCTFTVKTKRATDKDTLKKSITVSPETDFTLDGSGSSYTLKFGSALAADKVYTFSSLCGGRTVYQWAFQTSPDFTVTKVSLPKKLDDKKISFTFSYPDVSYFAKNFTISPEVDGTFACNGKTWTFTANEQFNPETTYTVTLKKSVSTENGLTLAKDYTATFTTPEPSGSFASIVRDDTDYACNYLPDEAPQVLIKSRGLKDKNVSVSVYKFGDYKSYLNAHKTYFEAPDLAHADKLISSLKEQNSFTSELIDYPSASYVNASQTELEKSLLVYPDVYSAGYYLSVIKLDSYTLYHLFRISPLSVYTLTCGNTLTVWVNNTKTGKPLFDSEVILDSTYDEKTDENGVVRFSLPENEKTAAYLVINDPNNSDLPFVSYIPLNSDYAATKVNADYNCVLYTDSDSYVPGDTITIFGAALPVSGSYSADSASLEYSIGSTNGTVGINPDKNGAFVAKITAPEDEVGILSLSLKINGIVAAKTSVNVNAKAQIAKKLSVNDTFLSASLDSGTLTISTNNVSSAPTNSSTLNIAASEKYGAAVYNTDAADIDYTISVIKRTLYQKQKNGSYYDTATKSTQPLYTYKRINKTETVQEITGKTVNGTSVRIISQKNEPQNGIYYSCKISYKNKAGKTVSYECGDVFGFADTYDSSAYNIAFDNASASDGTYGAAVTLGDKNITSGSVLCVPTYYNAYSAQLFSADKISLKPNSGYPQQFYVCSAYFDGRKIHTLNRSVITQSDKDYKLNVSVTADKTAYAKGDTVTLNIAVTDGGKPISAPVNICIKQASTADYITSPTIAVPQTNIAEKASGYCYGISRIASSYESTAAKHNNTDKAAHFELITTNNSGKATYTFTANEYGKSYVCEALCFSGYKSGQATAYMDCSQKAAVDISVPDKISVNDDFVITAAAQAAQNPQSATTAASTVKTNAAADKPTKAAEPTTVADNANTADAQYNVTATIYTAAKKGEKDYDDKLKLQTVQQTILAGERAQLSFGKLAAGKYTYIAEYEHLSEKRTVRGSLTVTAKNTVISPKIENITESGITPENSDSNVTAIVYKSSYSPMFTLAKKLYKSDADNLSQYIAQLAATRLFGAHENTALLKNYQKNGFIYTENGNADVYYTAAAAALCANFADKQKLISYFNDYIGSDDDTTALAAYFGLAALHEPVLD
ncbi:MAG: Ig-like domain-containing protein, partial [Acutalibacteraceae bacterium]